jgi:hypothetical protein
MSVRRNSRMRWAVGSLCAGAMLVGSVVPAMARDHGRYSGYDGYGGGYGYPSRHRGYRHYRHRDGLDAGDVIGIAALIGAVAIIASAAGKDKKASRSPDYRSDDRGYDGRTDSRDDYPASSSGVDEAINACVNAARDKAQGESGGYAEILDVERPRASGDNGWDVEGRLEQRRTYQDRPGSTKRFTCDVQGGRVAHVYISNEAA